MKRVATRLNFSVPKYPYSKDLTPLARKKILLLQKTIRLGNVEMRTVYQNLSIILRNLLCSWGKKYLLSWQTSGVWGPSNRVGEKCDGPHWPRLGAMCFAHAEWRREKVFRKRDEKALSCSNLGRVFHTFWAASGTLGHRPSTKERLQST